MRGLLFFRLDNGKEVEATPEMRAQMKQHADGFTTPLLLDTIRAFNSAATDLRGGWQPGLLLELAFAEAIEPKVAAPAPALAAAARPQAQPAAQPRNEMPADTPDRAPASTPVEAPARPSQSQQRPTAQPSTPATRAAEPAPASPEDGSGPITFQVLNQHWPRIRQLVKKRSPQTEALLNSGKLVGIKDGVLILGFSPVLKDKMETGNNLEITSQAITQATGAPLNVRCVLYSGKQAGGLPADVDVDSDGIVGTALRDLGGEVVDIQ